MPNTIAGTMREAFSFSHFLCHRCERGIIVRTHKICSECKEEKTVDNFYANGYLSGGERDYRAKCRSCEGKSSPRMKKSEVRNSIGGVKERKCCECGIWKMDGEPNFEVSGSQIRHKCRQCRNDQTKALRGEQKSKDIVLFKCKEMANSARARVMDASRAHKRGYRNLVNPYEFSSAAEMAEYLYANFHSHISTLIEQGESPSVDRKDSSIGYTKDNIRIISHLDNTLLGVATLRKKET